MSLGNSEEKKEEDDEEEAPASSMTGGDKLQRSVLSDEKAKGDVIKDAINMGVGSFTPDLMFEQLVKNYKNALNLYGPKIIRFLTGYDPQYLDKNSQIPEFQREVKKNIEENVEKLKNDGLLDKEGLITDKGYNLASVTLYMEELDNITPKGITGERFHKKNSMYGEKNEIKNFKRSDRYRDVAIRKSLRLAIRRGHSSLEEQDLKTFTRESKGITYVMYAMDCSGSMKGDKLETAKKAGIALAYKALEKKDLVGWIGFNDKIIGEVHPTHDFPALLFEMTKARANRETDIKNVIDKSIEMFPETDATKHIILLTDALPTIGKKPEDETIAAVSQAFAHNITISMIGISLDDKGKKLAKQIVEMGHGRLYLVKELANLDKIILEDYYEVM